LTTVSCWLYRIPNCQIGRIIPKEPQPKLWLLVFLLGVPATTAFLIVRRLVMIRIPRAAPFWTVSATLIAMFLSGNIGRGRRFTCGLLSRNISGNISYHWRTNGGIARLCWRVLIRWGNRCSTFGGRHQQCCLCSRYRFPQWLGGLEPLRTIRLLPKLKRPRQEQLNQNSTICSFFISFLMNGG